MRMRRRYYRPPRWVSIWSILFVYRSGAQYYRPRRYAQNNDEIIYYFNLMREIDASRRKYYFTSSFISGIMRDIAIRDFNFIISQLTERILSIYDGSTWLATIRCHTTATRESCHAADFAPFCNALNDSCYRSCHRMITVRLISSTLRIAPLA